MAIGIQDSATAINPVTGTFWGVGVGKLDVGSNRAKALMINDLLTRQRMESNRRKAGGADINQAISSFETRGTELYKDLEPKISGLYDEGYGREVSAIEGGYQPDILKEGYGAARGELEKGFGDISESAEAITKLHTDMIAGIDAFVAQTGITDPRHRINLIRGGVESSMSEWLGTTMPEMEARTGGRMSVPTTRMAMKDLFNSIVQMYPGQIEAAETAGMNIQAMKTNLGTWMGGMEKSIMDQKLGLRGDIAGSFMDEAGSLDALERWKAEKLGGAARFSTAGKATGMSQAASGQANVLGKGISERSTSMRQQSALEPQTYQAAIQAISSLPTPQSRTSMRPQPTKYANLVPGTGATKTTQAIPTGTTTTTTNKTTNKKKKT